MPQGTLIQSIIAWTGNIVSHNVRHSPAFTSLSGTNGEVAARQSAVFPKFWAQPMAMRKHSNAWSDLSSHALAWGQSPIETTTWRLHIINLKFAVFHHESPFKPSTRPMSSHNSHSCVTRRSVRKGLFST